MRDRKWREGEKMKYMVKLDITGAIGHQIFEVEANSEEEALKKHHNGESTQKDKSITWDIVTTVTRSDEIKAKD
jgi:hypothetical protein